MATHRIADFRKSNYAACHSLPQWHDMLLLYQNDFDISCQPSYAKLLRNITWTMEEIYETSKWTR